MPWSGGILWTLVPSLNLTVSLNLRKLLISCSKHWGIDADTLHRVAHPFSSTVFSIALNTMSLSQELPFDSNALMGWSADYVRYKWPAPCPKAGQLYGTIFKPEFSRGSGWVWSSAGLTPLPSPVLLCVPHSPVSSLEHIHKPPAQEPPALTMILWNLT